MLERWSSLSHARLVITRDHPEDIQDRPVYLWIDGEKWDGVLRYGKTFTRELAPGRTRSRRTTRCSRTPWSSTPRAGETVRFQCENGLTGGGMVMVLMMGVAYLRVRLTRLAD